MIIAHNITALRICNTINKRLDYSSKLMLQLSTGMRINSAADDPAGLAISEKMRAQIRGLDQASRNVQDGISLVQTADGALNETHAVLQRIRELVVQASNGTYSQSNRDNIQDEINQLHDEINRIAKDTEFNTINLLDGKANLTLQIGANAGQTMVISIGDMSSDALFDYKDLNIQGKTTDEISELLDVVDSAINKASGERGKLGSYQNVLEFRIDYLDNASMNLQAAESRIRDTDIAKTIMEYTKNNILLQVSLALLAQANQSQNAALKLLFGSLNKVSN